ncbi:MAG: AhpC/TSA family protein [Bacteroidales bacterium]|nr:AhpC/TSA family protein [Bacteroidales bacterium]
MKRTSAFLFFTLLLLFSARAQYDIKLEISNTKDDTIYLGYYWLGGTYAMDSAANNKGKFHFKSKDRSLDQGIYFFSNKTGKFCEFIVSDSHNMSFKTDDSDWAKNLTVKGSKDETIYLDYIKKSNELTAQFKELSKANYSKEVYSEKLLVLKTQNDSLKEDFIKRNPKHFLCKVLNTSIPINFPDFEKTYKEDGSIDSVALNQVGWNYYKKHYFDNMDLSCAGLLRTPKEIFSKPFDNFWGNMMKYEKADTIIYYADSLIQKTNACYEIKKFFINEVTRRYLQDNVMGHDRIYVHMIDTYFKTGAVDWMHASDIDMNITRADKWRNILVGQYVPDLACPELDEHTTWHSLSQMKGKYKVLVFWSIECGHCVKEIPKLAEWYNENKAKYNVEIFGVHTEGDISLLKDFASEHNISWTNVNGMYANYDWHAYFDIEKTPIIYILDTDNKILAKNISSEKIGMILDILEKGKLEL